MLQNYPMGGLTRGGRSGIMALPLARVLEDLTQEESMRELMGKDVHQVLREIALMELSLTKIGVESGIDIPMKLVVITEDGAAVLRDDMCTRQEMVDHVTRSVDKGIVTAVIAVDRAKVAEFPEDDVEGLLRVALVDREGLLRDIEESWGDIVICSAQYQVQGGGYSIAVLAEIVKGVDGRNTLGPTEFFVTNEDSGDEVPLAKDIVFDTNKFLPWTEN